MKILSNEQPCLAILINFTQFMSVLKSIYWSVILAYSATWPFSLIINVCTMLSFSVVVIGD